MLDQISMVLRHRTATPDLSRYIFTEDIERAEAGTVLKLALFEIALQEAGSARISRSSSLRHRRRSSRSWR